jgi:hypothetical protein
LELHSDDRDVGAGKRTSNKNQISYIFESGDSHQPEANAMMNFAFNHAHIRDFCMYAGHGFFPKERTTPCQAADLFAWQWFTDSRRRASGKYSRPRKDLVSLIGGAVVHKAVHADERFLTGMLHDMRRFYDGKPMLGVSSSGQSS